MKNTVEVEVAVYGRETPAGYTAYCPAFKKSVVGRRQDDAQQSLADAIKRTVELEQKLYETKHKGLLAEVL